MNMLYNKKENQLPEKNSNRQTTLIHDTDKSDAGMSIEHVNEYIVKKANEIKAYTAEKRLKDYIFFTDILPPYCHTEWTIKDNIDGAFVAYHNAMSAALMCESEYIKRFMDFESLKNIVDNEKSLIFDFLRENGLDEKFNDYVNSKKKKIKVLHRLK